MRILFAAADRDLLHCYEKLLTSPPDEVAAGSTSVETAFDGTQVLTAFAGGGYDLLILDQLLPRVPWQRIAAHVRAAGTPVLLLTPGPVTVKLLTSGDAVNAYLPYPFTPQELRAAIADLTAKRNDGRTLDFGAFSVKISDFRLGERPVCTGELELLERLAGGSAPAENDAAVYVSALNAKLEAVRVPARIRYQIHEGYRLVNDYE